MSLSVDQDRYILEKRADPLLLWTRDRKNTNSMPLPFVLNIQRAVFIYQNKYFYLYLKSRYAKVERTG